MERRRTRKRSEPVEVNVSQSGDLRIAQDDPQGFQVNTGQVVITIDLKDIDKVLQWIQEVKEELLKAHADGDFGEWEGNVEEE